MKAKKIDQHKAGGVKLQVYSRDQVMRIRMSDLWFSKTSQSEGEQGDNRESAITATRPKTMWGALQHKLYCKAGVGHISERHGDVLCQCVHLEDERKRKVVYRRHTGGDLEKEMS